MTDLKNCIYCDSAKPHYFSRTKPTLSKQRGKVYFRKIYTSSCGRDWAKNKCPDCVYEQQLSLANKRIGQQRRSATHPCKTLADGFSAEIVAKKHFENLGFTVKQARGLGPDLVCTIGDLSWTVEVKKAVIQYRGKTKNSYIVGPVTPNRQKDDLIAVVFDHGIYINSMSDHLKKCRKQGLRGVNDYRDSVLIK